MNNTYDELKKKIKMRDWIRYVLLIVYILIIIGYIIYVALGNASRPSIYIFIGLLFGFAVMVILVMYVYPIIRPLERPIVEDREVINLSEDYPHDEYYEILRFRLIYVIILPVMVVFAGFAIYGLVIEILGEEGGYILTIIHGSMLVFYILIFTWFSKMTLIGTTEELRVKFGPFRTKIKLSKIVSARPTAIKPWSTYLGYTWRVGSNGSIGYITGTKTGIRLEIEGKRRNYVLSTHQPQVLVNYIRKMKKS